MIELEQKIHKAIDNNKLKLVEGEKYWYNYFLSIQELVWVRNNHDGYLIDIFDKDKTTHLLRMIV